MDYKKSRKLLKKISKIIDVLAENEDRPNEIEYNLVRSYVKELYDTIGDTHSIHIQQSAPPQQANVIEVTPEEMRSTAQQPIQETPPPPVYNEPVRTTRTTPAAPTVPSYQPSASSDNDDVLDTLFNDDGGKELSDRLSNLPIKDLSKGMGINEKIHTIQELFGGNKGEFDSAISNLNNFSSFREAATYLKQGAAKSYDWGSEAKNKKAVTFIKLVRRRYR